MTREAFTDVLQRFGKLDNEHLTMEEQMIVMNALINFATSVKPLVDKYTRPQREYSADEIREILSRIPKDGKLGTVIDCSGNGEAKSGVTS